MELLLGCSEAPSASQHLRRFLSANPVIEISIIVPVLNEQTNVNQLIQHLESFLPQYALEVIVVDGDRTGTTINQITTQAPWLIKTSSQPGRGIQMNHGAKFAQGEILLFLHADTRLPTQSFNKIKSALKNPDIQGGAHDMSIATRNPILNWIGTLASLRSRLTRIPYGDQVIFIRRSTFEALGGYPDIPIMEDVAFMKKMKRRQAPIQILSDPVLISERRWRKEGILFTTLRNWSLLFLFELGVSPKRLVAWYKPHRT